MIPKHPMQPLVTDDTGTIRFRENKIVRFLLEQGPFDLNSLVPMALKRFPVSDLEQFYQLIGYSVSGYGELSFIRPETVEKADQKAADLRDALEQKEHDRKHTPSGKDE